MKLHPLGVIAGIVVAIAAGVAAAPWLRWVVGAASLVSAAVVVTAVRCHHRYATLLPPVHGAGPERDHARWYCDRCGHTWAATFVPETKPRLIYGGYDAHKALRSAARADALEKERRRMAVKRAGWAQSPGAQGNANVATQMRPGPRAVDVVPMRRVRES
jgi:hypothetical protein